MIGCRDLRKIFLQQKIREPNIKGSEVTHRFRFADRLFDSLGKVTLFLSTPSGIPPIRVVLDVVRANIPALLGMDVLDREALIADTVAGRLTKRVKTKSKEGQEQFVDEWSVPLYRAPSRHVFARMHFAFATFFARSQLLKLHKQFFHPSAQKLFNLLCRARPEEATPETLSILEDLSKRCDPCQRIQNAPRRFRVSFGADHVRFNERILLDIMYINGSAILHIVDEGTHFSAARFLADVSTKTIWKTILECWACIYTGLPNRMLVDQGSAFGPLFVSIWAMSNVEVQRTGIEAHSSLGIGERYHQPLRQTYRKIMATHPTAEPDVVLALSDKAMNDTLAPEGLVPTALVLGEYPPVHTKTETLTQRAVLATRAEISNAARQEMEKIMAELRVKRALNHATPSSANILYSPGDDVQLWREKQFDSRIGEWVGPFTVVAVDDLKKLVFVQDVRIGQARPFTIAQVKRYHQPEQLSTNFMSDVRNCIRYFGSPEDEEVYRTEIISRSDPRANSREMESARRQEIKNLLERGTFKVILKEDIPKDANILPGRFLLSLKSTEDNNVKYKARYVIGGHRDRLKHMMVHSTSTLQPSSIRLLLALAIVHGFDIWTSDVRQAYLQSADPLSRPVFISKPVPKFELEPSQCLQLLKPLYGLCESGDL